MKIYTKTGDEGQTGLLGGDRISKDSARMDAIGTIDELNALFGISVGLVEDEALRSRLVRVQNQLFDLGSELACPTGGKFDLRSVDEGDIALLESEIDAMEGELPPLKSFILPGGTPAASHMHFVRTVCRRAERVLLAHHRVNPVRKEIIMYMNRLSDWIFSFSRLLNHRSGVEEQKWTQGVKS
ncbi:MAG: cob(I)yrinic acid a,c-diamide adenosyltransferase [Armatimonadetes bacterium]|nr:cob(I)yrinic acid a,c-diamide adenosyltransferase [Armatimonadota bacterium]